MFDKFVLTIAMGIVRGWLNGTIGNFSPQELYVAICENRDLWGSTPDNLKGKGRHFKRLYGSLYQKYASEITTDLILRWLKEDHPHLENTILNASGGVAWLDNQVKKIKSEIFEL